MTQINYRQEIEKYKSGMTPKERLIKYIEGQAVDHLPYTVIRIENPMFESMGYTTSDFNNNFEIKAEMIQRGIDDYGIRGISAGLGLRTLGAACGSKLSFPIHGFDHIEEFILEDSLDVGKLDIPDPRDNEILTPILELAGKLKERFPKEDLSTGIVGPFTAAASFRPVEKLLKDTRKNEEDVKALLDFSVRAQLKWVEDFVEEYGNVSVSISDPVSSTDLLSPKQFEKLSLPYLKELVDGVIKITGKKPSIHICGHTKGIWKYIGGLNLSSFSVDNCEDIGEVKEALGDKMLIVGNVPPTTVLGLGNSEEVIESVRDCIRKAADSPCGYMVGTGCATILGTPLENMDAYVYAIMKYSKGAKKGEIPKTVER